jgi:hypothetical protein
MYTPNMWNEGPEVVDILKWRRVPLRSLGVRVVMVRGAERFLWMAIMTPRDGVREFDANVV